MAKLNEQQYQRRSDNAARRNLENVAILIENGVNEDIAKLIADDLASTRHDFHINTKSIFNSESGYDTNEVYEIIVNGLNAINELCSTSYYITDVAEWTSDIDLEYATDELDEESEDYEDERVELYNQYYAKWADEAEEINRTIQNAMREVDKKYGTNISPTGSQRIY